MIEGKVTVRHARDATLAISVVLLAVAVTADAQPPKKVSRIGFLAAVSHSANSARFEAFRQGLRELGYVEGKDVGIEWRYADGTPIASVKSPGRWIIEW